MPKDKNYTEDEHFLSRMYLKEFSEIKKKGNKEKAFVWQYNIKAMRHTPVQVNIQNICFEKNLYEFGDAGHYSTTDIFTFEAGGTYEISSGTRGDFYFDDAGGFTGQ
jgi:hypothetical protein